MEQASDEQFQAWVVASGLADLVDDNGVVGWCFDDRCRLINFALRSGKVVPFANETIPSGEQKNSPTRIVSELFERDNVVQEAGAADSMPDGAA